MEQFNLVQFANKLYKNPCISLVKAINKRVVEITYTDSQTLFIDTVGDNFHKFYTFVPKNDDSIYYMGKMPHNTYDDLYVEINRMNTQTTRKQPCKYPYFKCNDLFM